MSHALFNRMQRFFDGLKVVFSEQGLIKQLIV